MIQSSARIAQGAQREILPVRQIAESFHKLPVIGHLHRNIPDAELPEIAGRPLTRRHVKIIAVHHRVGRSEHNGLRPPLRQFLSRPGKRLPVADTARSSPLPT